MYLMIITKLITNYLQKSHIFIRVYNIT